MNPAESLVHMFRRSVRHPQKVGLGGRAQGELRMSSQAFKHQRSVNDFFAEVVGSCGTCGPLSSRIRGGAGVSTGPHLAASLVGLVVT